MTGRVSLVERAHALAAEVLAEGEIAVDATVGNGHDTLFLAGCVGASGKVYGFDCQPTALQEATRRLEAAGLAGRVTLYNDGHQDLLTYLPPAVHGRVRAVLFNLGYLPGGDHALVTTTGTTLAALAAAAQVLGPGGRLIVVAYTGHPGGAEEAAAVGAWMGELGARWRVEKIDVAGRQSAPVLWRAELSNNPLTK